PDSVDPAFRRPGRFDRELFFSHPDRNARLAILNIHTKNWPSPLSQQMSDYILDRSSGWSGAEISSFVNEIALSSIRRNFPDLHDYKDKIQIDTSKIHITNADVISAMNKLFKFSQSFSNNLGVLDPLLGKVCSEVCDIFLSSKTTNTICDPKLSEIRSSGPSNCRVLVSGSPGMGQESLRIAISQKLTEFKIPNYSLNPASLLTCDMQPESLISSHFNNAKKNSGVIILSDLQNWCYSDWIVVLNHYLSELVGQVHTGLLVISETPDPEWASRLHSIIPAKHKFSIGNFNEDELILFFYPLISSSKAFISSSLDPFQDSSNSLEPILNNLKKSHFSPSYKKSSSQNPACSQIGSIRKISPFFKKKNPFIDHLNNFEMTVISKVQSLIRNFLTENFHNSIYDPIRSQKLLDESTNSELSEIPLITLNEAFIKNENFHYVCIQQFLFEFVVSVDTANFVGGVKALEATEKLLSFSSSNFDSSTGVFSDSDPLSTPIIPTASHFGNNFKIASNLSTNLPGPLAIKRLKRTQETLTKIIASSLKVSSSFLQHFLHKSLSNLDDNHLNYKLQHSNTRLSNTTYSPPLSPNSDDHTQDNITENSSVISLVSLKKAESLKTKSANKAIEMIKPSVLTPSTSIVQDTDLKFVSKCSDRTVKAISSDFELLIIIKPYLSVLDLSLIEFKNISSDFEFCESMFEMFLKYLSFISSDYEKSLGHQNSEIGSSDGEFSSLPNSLNQNYNPHLEKGEDVDVIIRNSNSDSEEKNSFNNPNSYKSTRPRLGSIIHNISRRSISRPVNFPKISQTHNSSPISKNNFKSTQLIITKSVPKEKNSFPIKSEPCINSKKIGQSNSFELGVAHMQEISTNPKNSLMENIDHTFTSYISEILLGESTSIEMLEMIYYDIIGLVQKYQKRSLLVSQEKSASFNQAVSDCSQFIADLKSVLQNPHH
ncbi:putative AAA domain-containing protein, partial [Smittium culicis]